MNVVGYCRFSSEGQRDGYSIEAQKEAITGYCDINGYTLLRFYVDEAQTGTDDERESFLDMIDATKGGEIDAIVVHKLDRFARNRYDSAIYGDRKSVVQGKSVAYCVDLGGRRIIKKNFFQAEDGIRDNGL